MIDKDQTSPSVFTDSGKQWLENMITYMKNGNYKESKDLGNHKSWRSVSYENGVVPQEHPNFGEILENPGQPQYLLISTHSGSQDLTKTIGPGPDPRDTHPTYQVEDFGKVRIYNEAVARGVEQLFAPITGWDGKEFRWITMPLLKNIRESDGGTHKADPIKK